MPRDGLVLCSTASRAATIASRLVTPRGTTTRRPAVDRYRGDYFPSEDSHQSEARHAQSRFHQPGGPEVLMWEEVTVGKPGPGEARVRHTAVELNYIDIYTRRGLYPAPLPSGLDTEAAGVVEAGRSGCL